MNYYKVKINVKVVSKLWKVLCVNELYFLTFIKLILFHFQGLWLYIISWVWLWLWGIWSAEISQFILASAAIWLVNFGPQNSKVHSVLVTLWYLFVLCIVHVVELDKWDKIAVRNYSVSFLVWLQYVHVTILCCKKGCSIFDKGHFLKLISVFCTKIYMFAVNVWWWENDSDCFAWSPDL
jgi:hypothetical protein